MSQNVPLSFSLQKKKQLGTHISKKCAVSVGRKDSVIRVCNADPGFQVTDGAHLYLGKSPTDILNGSFDFENT